MGFVPVNKPQIQCGRELRITSVMAKREQLAPNRFWGNWDSQEPKVSQGFLEREQEPKRVAAHLNQLAFVGNHLPRQCGIATFTSDLCEAMAAAFPLSRCLVGAINDRSEGYNYPARIRFEIEEKEIDSYHRAAGFLNANNVELVSVQHEFGIFGGPAGSHLLALLRDLKMPVVTTLHTVLRKPDFDQRALMDQLNDLSKRFIVMAERGKEFLSEIYGIASEKIDVIPHGIPEIPLVDPNINKHSFGLEGKIVLLTFGLLSPNKGIEYVIEALPAILEKHPDVVYIVLGSTHPNIVARDGESYRLQLERLAESLGVASHVIFRDCFVTLEELKQFIGAADIYITPYLNESQITSGTLAYAFGAGKAVISTPYWHAQELLASNRGILVPFANSERIGEAVNRYLSDAFLMAATRKRAWKLGRRMTWPVVARRHMESFERARAGFSERTLSSCLTVGGRNKLREPDRRPVRQGTGTPIGLPSSPMGN
jgi:glycosyltransferase involved in cell wall biosynthesis